uniref:Uncharacterized protein n=1 Tax=Triticum urartu TaxID=4572 RepID=A0A8R7UL41_TRIUA
RRQRCRRDIYLIAVSIRLPNGSFTAQQDVHQWRRARWDVCFARGMEQLRLSRRVTGFDERPNHTFGTGGDAQLVGDAARAEGEDRESPGGKGDEPK